MKGLKTILITVVGVILLLVAITFAVFGVENKAIGLEEQIKTAKSDIQVQEKRRVDLLYNLVDTVKNYDKHESETLKDVVEARAKGSANFSDVNTMISAVSEAYPELKSDKNYQQLMTELSVTENLVAQYRSNYNSAVKDYQRYTRKFPNRQLLSLVGYETDNYGYLNYDAPVDAPQNLFEDK